MTLTIYLPDGTKETHGAEYVGVLAGGYECDIGSPVIRKGPFWCYVQPLAVIVDETSGDVLYEPYDALSKMSEKTRKYLVQTAGVWPARILRALKWREN